MKRWFSGLRGRLVLMMLIPFVVMSLVTLWTHVGFWKVDRSIAEIEESRIPSVRNIELINEGQTSVGYSLAMAAGADQKARAKFIEAAESKLGQILIGRSTYENLTHTPDEESAWADTTAKLDQWQTQANAVLDLLKAEKFDQVHSLLYGAYRAALDSSSEALAKAVITSYQSADTNAIAGREAQLFDRKSCRYRNIYRGRSLYRLIGLSSH